MQKQALVLLGHGSRSKDAIEDFNFIIEEVRLKSKDLEVFGAHMEIAEPSLETIISEIVKLEIEKVIIMPYFLFTGNHIKFDIPKKIKALCEQYPKLEIVLGTPIGKEPMMAELMLTKTAALIQQ